MNMLACLETALKSFFVHAEVVLVNAKELIEKQYVAPVCSKDPWMESCGVTTNAKALIARLKCAQYSPWSGPGCYWRGIKQRFSVDGKR
jgi:hypothetical protein